jgi:hypothetical protein
VQTYIYSQAHELKFHLQLVSVRFNTASPTWGTHDVFCVNIVKDFPFLSEMRLSDLHMTTSGDDPENPHCPWTFIELRNTPHGTFYFLIQGVEPSALFTAPENVFRFGCCVYVLDVFSCLGLSIVFQQALLLKGKHHQGVATRGEGRARKGRVIQSQSIA